MFLDYEGEDSLSISQAHEVQKLLTQQEAAGALKYDTGTPTVEVWSVTGPRVSQALVGLSPPAPSVAEANGRPYYMEVLRAIVGVVGFPQLELIEARGVDDAQLQHWAQRDFRVIQVATGSNEYTVYVLVLMSRCRHCGIRGIIASIACVGNVVTRVCRRR
jgi:hypothetical protein